MATSKTLKPTNTTVSIPAMADRPNQSVNSNTMSAIVDAVNAIHDNVVYIKALRSSVAAGNDLTFTMSSGQHALVMAANAMFGVYYVDVSGTPTSFPINVPSGWEISNSGSTITVHRTNGTAFVAAVLLM